MDDLKLQDIYVYPIKSLGGIRLQEAEVLEAGLQYDRRWMLTDKTGEFLSQRTLASLALLQVNLLPDGLLISHKKNTITPLTIPFAPAAARQLTVQVWDDECAALEVAAFANEWFSDALKTEVRLVKMPDATRRLVDTKYAKNNETVSFADGYPFLLISQASLDDLNRKLETPVSMDRFRPNFVMAGGAPYCEDMMGTFCIAGITFEAVKPCKRCVMTTINQEDGSKGKEPLKTLATYRKIEDKVIFGQNLLHTGAGVVKAGDEVSVLKWKEGLHFTN
ncbi:MAG TPA: MOSC N-terminal beta barrel domain-containing protein [Segetibacter sp.]|jgi:hypothetical protein